MIAQKQMICPTPETDYLACLLKELEEKKKEVKNMKR